MTPNEEARTLAAWLIDRLDGEQPARAALKAAVARLDAAQHLHDARHVAMHEARTALEKHLHEAQNKLQAHPRPATLDAYCAAVSDRTTLLMQHDTERQANETVLSAARGAVTAMLSRHSIALLPVLTAERCQEVTRCGSDAVSPQAHQLHARIDVRLHPQLPPELTLPILLRTARVAAQLRTLPLTWSEHDSAAFRASLAWCWLELDAGRYVEVNAPLTNKQKAQGLPPDTNGKCLRFTQVCDVLPPVQPAKPLTKKR